MLPQPIANNFLANVRLRDAGRRKPENLRSGLEVLLGLPSGGPARRLQRPPSQRSLCKTVGIEEANRAAVRTGNSLPQDRRGQIGRQILRARRLRPLPHTRADDN
jgi:hypothetical protein